MISRAMSADCSLVALWILTISFHSKTLLPNFVDEDGNIYPFPNCSDDVRYFIIFCILYVSLAKKGSHSCIVLKSREDSFCGTFQHDQKFHPSWLNNYPYSLILNWKFPICLFKFLCYFCIRMCWMTVSRSVDNKDIYINPARRAVWRQPSI